ncbi:MAG: SpoVG family protein [Lachnospiraceae bacterium]|nr:SpoVG family protein [Lachnospiraceae bacterium]
MTITDVKVRKLNEPKGALKAFAGVTIDDAFAVHDIRVIETEKGAFIAFPSKKDPKGNFHDICHPITPECRKTISDAILNAYNS